jgi:hypothetical protein
MKKSLVCLETFDTYAEAALCSSALRARGIRTALAGPDSSSTFGSYFGPLSHVSVMVTEETARRLKKKPINPEPRRPATCRSRQPRTPLRLPAARRGHREKPAE